MLSRIFRVARPALQIETQPAEPKLEPATGELIAAHGRALARWAVEREVRGAMPTEQWWAAYHQMTREAGIDPIPDANRNDLIAAVVDFRGGLQVMPRLVSAHQIPAPAVISKQASNPCHDRSEGHVQASMVRTAANDDRTELPRRSRKDRAREYLGELSGSVYQSELPSRWRVCKSMASQWLAEWEMEGVVVRQRMGRDVIVRRADVVDIQAVAVNG